MKVTLVHQYFKHPREGGAVRSYFLAKGLLDKGHMVEVITTHNHRHLEIRRIEGIKVFYLPNYYDNALSKYQRIWAFLKFVAQAIRLLHILKRPGLLYVISTPLTVGVIALWAKYVLRVNYIFEIGDLWPEAPIQLGYIKNPIIKRLLYGFEKRVYQSAYKIVAMSPDIKRIIKQGEKVVMIPNMADCNFFKHVKKKPVDLLERYRLDNEFVIAYLGTAGRANHLDYLLSAAEAFQVDQLNVKIVVAAAGSELEHFRSNVLQAQLHNVVFVPYTHKEGVRDLLSIADAVYVSFAKVPILSSGSPNKFFDGLAAGKLIITNFGGWVKQEIETAQCGFDYDPEYPDQFIRRLTPYIEDKPLRKRAQLNARQLAESKFSRTRLIEQWLPLFD